jgi:hypothetical protein
VLNRWKWPFLIAEFGTVVVVQSQLLTEHATVCHVSAARYSGRFCCCSHACYGSFETSHPALLPFLSCMPQWLAAAAARQPAAIASALWNGCELLTAPAQRATAATCYQVNDADELLSPSRSRIVTYFVFSFGASMLFGFDKCMHAVQECYCFLLSRAAATKSAGSAAAPDEGTAPASTAGSSATTLLHAALCQGPVETALLPGSPGLAAMGAEAVAAVLTQVLTALPLHERMCYDTCLMIWLGL